MEVPPPSSLSHVVDIPVRLLLGPGPSNAADSVLAAMNRPLLGHLHKEFTRIMDEVKEGLQYAFQTRNTLTFAVSGTGHAGMECALVNVLEPGECLLLVDIGFWGGRVADVAQRCGIIVQRVTATPGTAITFAALEEALALFHPAAVFVVHGESSTGVCQPLDGIGALCRSHSALFIVDTVASLGGAPFFADRLMVDCVYSATQKVLNAPPGLAPISFSDRAIEKMRNRRQKVQSFYLDALELGNYWGCFEEPRRYHHTGMISCMYALREALVRLVAEGLEECVKKHAVNAAHLYKGIENIGLSLFVEDEKVRLPCLTTVKVPDGVDAKAITDAVMKQGIEIAGGLGPTAGKVWRIGTFGINSSPDCINAGITALKKALTDYRASAHI